MKNLLLLLIIASAFMPESYAQDVKMETPAKVIMSFEQKFPAAKKVKWEKESGLEWEAEFKMNGTAYSANFSEDGEWMETEHEIKKSAIPANIKSILDDNFEEYEIEEAEIAEKKDGLYYEFEIEIEEEEYEVVIDPKGKLTKKNIEEDDEKDWKN